MPRRSQQLYILHVQREIKKNSRGILPFLPGGWLFHWNDTRMNTRPLGVQWAIQAKMWVFFFLTRRKLKAAEMLGAWSWRTLPNSKSLGPTLASSTAGKGIQQSNQQVNMQWKKTEVAATNKPSSSLVFQGSPGVSEDPHSPPPCTLSLSFCLLPSLFPPFFSLTCTPSRTNSLWNDFFFHHWGKMSSTGALRFLNS